MAKLPENFDWRTSHRHIWYLEQFRKPKTDEPHQYGYPARELKESEKSAIERFVRDGALEECNLEAKVDRALRVSEIKEILRRHGQKSSGDKAELIAAVVQAARQELEEKTRKFKLYKCTPSATALVEAFNLKSKEVETRAQSEAHLQLLNGDPKAAFAIYVAFWRATCDPKYSSEGSHVEMMRFILETKPKVIGEMDDKRWRQLQAAVAMKHLWHEVSEASWLQEDFTTPTGDVERAISLLRKAANFQRDLAWRASLYKQVKLVFNRDNIDLCESCAALDGKVFNSKEVPEVPTEHCTSRDGCTCRLGDSVDSEDGDEDNTITVTLDEKSLELIDDTVDDPVVKLRQIKQMLDDGLIEKDEYQKKKDEILSRI